MTLPGGATLVETERGSAHLSNLFTGIRVIATYSTVEAWERAVAQDFPGFRRKLASPSEAP